MIASGKRLLLPCNGEYFGPRPNQILFKSKEQMEALHRHYSLYPLPARDPRDKANVFRIIYGIMTIPQNALEGWTRILACETMDEFERRERNLASSLMAVFGSPPANASEFYVEQGTHLGAMALPAAQRHMVTQIQGQYILVRHHLQTLVQHILNYDGRPMDAGPEGDLFRFLVASVSHAQHPSVARAYPFGTHALKKYILDLPEAMMMFDTPLEYLEHYYPRAVADAHLYYEALLERIAMPWKDFRNRVLYAVEQRIVRPTLGRAPPGGNMGGSRKGRKGRKRAHRKNKKTRRGAATNKH
jgi:hypothetical protein